MSVDAIVESFEIAAERAGDVAPAIYDAYFARCPESRELMRYVRHSTCAAACSIACSRC